MKLKYTLSIILLFHVTLCFSQQYLLKSQIENALFALNGEITQDKLNLLKGSLFGVSLEEEMCFITLGQYNNCESGRKEVYPFLMIYMDDLIGKEVSVKLTKWNKPWEDEDYYELTFKIVYKNNNPDWPVETNFDTINFGIVKNTKIKNITYSREWINLSAYGEE